MSSTSITGPQSLGADINKLKTDITPETEEGVVSDKLPELAIDMEDSEIVKLANNWQRLWNDSPNKSKWEEQIKDNEDYWLGKQFDKPAIDKSRAMVDNLIFESVETYLPQVTRRNPEPLITLDEREDDEGNKYEKYIEKTKRRMVGLADRNRIRLKLKKAARHWAIFQLGVGKLGWDLDKDIPIVRIIRPKKVILDPEATIDEDGYTGNRIGEHRKMEASKLLRMVEGSDESTKKAKDAIKEMAKDDMSTEIGFIEWWTPKMFFWKLKNTILLKKQNPHWNYDREEKEVSVDDYGTETESQKEVKGINHFPTPRMPYVFLSVFNLGDQPMDKTSLIGQNLANQDLINKRNKQIDKNADSMNGGMVVSLSRSGLTQSQAAGVSKALRKGGTVVIPEGAPREAVDRFPTPGLPADIYNQLVDTRRRLRDIFGTGGSTPAGVKEEDTVRGKILSKGLDTDRIGGGVSEFLEQFADDIYNWFLQLLYVYDAEYQFIDGAIPPRLNVSVKEGSLLPKDSISIANQALELASMNRMSNIDLYKRLEYPNPEEMAANVWLETNAPHILYKDNPMIQEALALQQQNAQAEEQARLEEEERSHAKEIEK